MDLYKNKKALFLTDMESELGPILQKATNIQIGNMFMIQSYGNIISHPYGDIMRSIILAIYQENVEDIFVVGTKEKRPATVNVLTQLESMKDKIQTLDYLFQNSRPEFSGGTVNEWLNGKENGDDQIKKSVDIIRQHPLVPSHVKVRRLIVNNSEEEVPIVEVFPNKQLKQCQA